MAQFTGRLQGPNSDPSRVLIDISDERFSVSTGRVQIGSWEIQKISAERTSIFRFELNIDGNRYDFNPEDPSAFSDAVGAVIDLTESKSRFGIKARIERTANG